MQIFARISLMFALVFRLVSNCFVNYDLNVRKEKAFALAALGLRNAYILKNRVIKHQFLPEIRNQEKQHQIPFPSPSRPLDKSELGIFSEGEI